MNTRIGFRQCDPRFGFLWLSATQAGAQEDARQRDDSKHVPRPYAGALHTTWARCLIDGRLCYLTLSMAAWHLYATMQEAAANEVQRLLPYSYVVGPDDAKVERGLIRWDSRGH